MFGPLVWRPKNAVHDVQELNPNNHRDGVKCPIVASKWFGGWFEDAKSCATITHSMSVQNILHMCIYKHVYRCKCADASRGTCMHGSVRDTCMRAWIRMPVQIHAPIASLRHVCTTNALTQTLVNN